MLVIRKPALSGMEAGEIDPTQAFMQGKIKIHGDISFALSLSALGLKK